MVVVFSTQAFRWWTKGRVWDCRQWFPFSKRHWSLENLDTGIQIDIPYPIKNKVESGEGICCTIEKHVAWAWNTNKNCKSTISMLVQSKRHVKATIPVRAWYIAHQSRKKRAISFWYVSYLPRWSVRRNHKKLLIPEIQIHWPRYFCSWKENDLRFCRMFLWFHSFFWSILVIH